MPERNPHRVRTILNIAHFGTFLLREIVIALLVVFGTKLFACIANSVAGGCGPFLVRDLLTYAGMVLVARLFLYAITTKE